jgi:hypothetical protein
MPYFFWGVEAREHEKHDDDRVERYTVGTAVDSLCWGQISRVAKRGKEVRRRGSARAHT